MSSAGSKPALEATIWPFQLDAEDVKQLSESACDVVLVLDGFGVIHQVTARDADLLKSARRDWRGRHWADTVTGESRGKVADLIDAAFANIPSAPRQLNHPAKDKPDLPVRYTVVRVSGSASAPQSACLIALGHDLRDSVALQRRLVDAQQSMERDYWRFREAETRYRNLFQSSSEAVLIVDGTSLRILEANPAANALLGDGAKPGKTSGTGAALATLFAADATESISASLASARNSGKTERALATLAGSGRQIQIVASSFRQDEAFLFLVRLAPVADTGSAQTSAALRPQAGDRNGSGDDSAFVRSASDALAFTNNSGRVITVNRAFARLAQLASEEQARGESLDRWIGGRTGVELSMLLTNLREGGSTGLFSTELRGTQGLVTEVEIAGSKLEPAGAATFAFSIRDVGRRLAPSESALPTKVPASVQQLTELVGRVPLKQIISETGDLIERLSIETALAMTKDNRAMAAQLLGLSRQSLYVKLRRFGMGGLDKDVE
jgi:transcriptional regulator PpsR